MPVRSPGRRAVAGFPRSLRALIDGSVVRRGKETGEPRDLFLAADGLVAEHDEALHEVEPADARIECVSAA
jgi:hypothetical protein